MAISSAIQTYRDHLINLKQQATGYPFLKTLFLKKHGYPLNLDQPKTFCEWVNFKKVRDRNPLIPITSDKFQVRQYIRQKLGRQYGDELLIPLLHVSKTGTDIPFDKLLEEEFFLKANHCSGSNLHVKPGTDPRFLKSTCEKWLNSSYGQSLHEWGYRDIPRKIICEKVLRDGQGRLPLDFKFYCIHGQVEMIGIFYKSEKQSFACYLDPLLREVGGPMGEDIPMPEIPKIPNLDRLLRLAETLSEEFELVRIDLYSVEDKIHFGEITHYPGSGLDRFDCQTLDFNLGKKISEGRLLLQKAGA